MGHYYAEMACGDCGQLRCVCPREEKTEAQRKKEEKEYFSSGRHYKLMKALQGKDFKPTPKPNKIKNKIKDSKYITADDLPMEYMKELSLWLDKAMYWRNIQKWENKKQSKKKTTK